LSVVILSGNSVIIAHDHSVLIILLLCIVYLWQMCVTVGLQCGQRAKALMYLLGLTLAISHLSLRDIFILL